MTNASFIPTILCGGAGSRLWPVSRELHPKPFIRLADGQSLLQKAFLRAAALPHADEILTVTNREIFFKIEDELCSINSNKLTTSYILEPFGRNTAASISSAALYVAEAYGEDAILLVLPADHLIAQPEPFAEAVAEAIELAKSGKLVTFGIQPVSPETAYGYIEAEGNNILRFIEKPAYAVAQEYVASGRYLWNSGMFCFTARVILHELEQYCPEILAATRTCMAHSQKATGRGFMQLELDQDTFVHVPNESIDYAVMEKSSNAAVVPCNIGWSDIGSWSALSDLAETDSEGNSIEGKALIHDTRNCHIQSSERVVGAVGVSDLVIIDTPDALLVANRERTQDVKHLYAMLKEQGHEAHKLHRTVHRPWGTYTVLEEGPGFKIKRIEVKAHASLSLQMHQHRSEHWIVVSGIAKVVNGEREFIVNINESTYIPPKHLHRLSNPDHSPLVIIEVQSGQYLGEDDIVRFEDAYGRV